MSSVADRLRASARENGIDDRFPLISDYVGEHVVQFTACKFTDSDCLIASVEILESGNPDLKEGTTCQVLRKLGGKNRDQKEVRDKLFNGFVIRAFGYDNVGDIEENVPDWLDQVLETTEPGFIGRLSTVRVVASDKQTQRGQTINNDYWDTSEEAS